MKSMKNPSRKPRYSWFRTAATVREQPGQIGGSPIASDDQSNKMRSHYDKQSLFITNMGQSSYQIVRTI